QPDADLHAEPLDGAAGGPHAAGLAEVVGEFRVRPVGPVEALPGRPVDDPAAQLAGQRRGDVARLALGLLGSQGVEGAAAVGVEPAGDGPGVDAQVGGDVLAGAAPVGHQDDLEAVPELAVGGGAEECVEAFSLGRWQVNADHGAVPSQHGSGYIRVDNV